MGYLDMVNSPADIKRLHLDQLKELASEVRTALSQGLSKGGGHLAPNLGVVELTIALHRVFDSPKDRFVMDVSHQCYVHKMFTGRRDRLPIIRQTDGICGFLLRDESPYDCYGAGHAGTALSAALGMATARDLRKSDEHIIAILGDAALTNGITYEAMNNVAQATKRLIVILNDNEWSIDKNVGAISKLLNRLVTSPTYNKLHRKLEGLIERLPKGDKLVTLERKAEEAAKGILTSASVVPAPQQFAAGRGGTVPSLIFEELGLRYFGPIDGHDLPLLIGYLEFAKKADHPILIHIITQKGRGAPFALENPEKFHGCGPYDPVTGKGPAPKPGAPPNWQDVFGDATVKLCQTNSKVVGITAAMPSGTGLSRLKKAMPERYFDVGIAEEHAVLFAAGMATMGYKPICAIYSTFLQRAYDPIVHDVALQRLPVIFCMDRAGFSASDSPTHHGTYDIAYLRGIPNVVHCQPKDEDELVDLMFTATHYWDGPFFIRYPRGPAVGVPIKEYPAMIPIGKGEVLQPGSDVAIFGLGNMLELARAAAKMLEEKGLSCAIINPRWIKPLDLELIETFARRCKVLLTFEDHVIKSGFGSAVLEALEEMRLRTPLVRVGWPDRFLEWASNNNVLRQRHGLTVEIGVEKVLAVLQAPAASQFRVVAKAG